jgi:hypothetical protein
MNNFEYKNLTPFKWFVLENFPFIEADFDALTNWQLFCKLGQEMNKIINSVNTSGEQVQTLTDAFNKLQDYVNNYFKNLDVQEEINNKLDEMANSGELTEIIAQYLQLAGLLCFNTLNELKNATNIVAGSFTKTFGKNSYNDGLGEFYKIRNITNDDIVDEINIIKINNSDTLIAELIKNATIDKINATIDKILNELTKKTNIDELNQERLQSKYNTYGMNEKGVGLSAMVNSDINKPGIMGFGNPAEVSSYTQRDCAGLYIRALPSIPILNYNKNDAIYTSNSVIADSLTDEEIENLKNTDLTDTVIDTYNINQGSIVRCSGLIDRFEAETKTFYIKESFYGVPSQSQMVTPPDNTNFYIGLCTKVWGANIVSKLPSDSLANSATGAEIELVNLKETSIDNTILDLVGIPVEGKTVQYGLKIRGQASNRPVSRGIDLKNISYIILNSQIEDSGEHYIIFNQNLEGKTTFYIYGDGRMTRLAYQRDLITSKTQLPNRLIGYHIYSIPNYDGSSVTFLNPTDDRILAGTTYIIQNGSAKDLVLSYSSGSDTKTFTIPRAKTKMIISDGASWNIIE